MMTMVGDEQNGSTANSLKNRTKYRTTIVIVLVSSCLVALAVVFVFTKPPNEKLSTEMLNEHI